MARKLRLEYAGACYHVINRGNYRRHGFASKGASDSFDLLAVLMKKRVSVSNRWLANRLSMGGPGSVSSLVTRFQREGRTETPEFQALYSRFAS